MRAKVLRTKFGECSSSLSRATLPARDSSSGALELPYQHTDETSKCAVFASISTCVEHLESSGNADVFGDCSILGLRRLV